MTKRMSGTLRYALLVLLFTAGAKPSGQYTRLGFNQLNTNLRLSLTY